MISRAVGIVKVFTDDLPFVNPDVCFVSQICLCDLELEACLLDWLIRSYEDLINCDIELSSLSLKYTDLIGCVFIHFFSEKLDSISDLLYSGPVESSLSFIVNPHFAS